MALCIRWVAFRGFIRSCLGHLQFVALCAIRIMRLQYLKQPRDGPFQPEKRRFLESDDHVPSNAKHSYIGACMGNPSHPHTPVLQINPREYSASNKDAKRCDQGA